MNNGQQKNLRIFTTIFLISIIGLSYGQTSSDTKKKNYCGSTSICPIGKDNPAHFDPYYNGHLCENFNPQQIDFSKEYFELQTKRYSKYTDQLQLSLIYDYSSIWYTGNLQQNGVLGLNYQRIQFHIGKVVRSQDKPDTYIIYGKSKVNDNICNFSGELKLLKLFFTECEDSSFNKCGELFGSYKFFEDRAQYHSGVFMGIMECSVRSDSTGKRMLLDDSFDGADGYWNRTFIGTWTDYKTKQAKKCIWGDYRLPFTFDFDCGDGEMMVCDKYKMNGWQTFNNISEYVKVGQDKWELKNMWWITK